MKIQHSLTICALSVCLAALGKAQDIKFTVPPTSAATQDQAPAPSAAPASAAEAPAAAPAPSAFSEQQKAEEFGWFLTQKFGIAQWGFSQAQAEAIGRGLVEGLEGRDSPFDLQKIGPEMDAVYQGPPDRLL